MAEIFKPAEIKIYKNTSEMIAAFPEPLIHYESDGVILLQDCGFEFDESYLSTITLPVEMKKIGTREGITSCPFIFRDGGFLRTENPLCEIVEDDRLLLKIYSEFLRIELSFKLLVKEVFPTYHQINWDNCTFRFTKTRGEDLHLDSFNKGSRIPLHLQLPRLKFFLNLDKEARIWHVGPTLWDILKNSKEYLGCNLPDDLNMLCMHLNRSGVFERCPKVRLEIPSRGIIFANGQTVMHQVVYGNRMVALEGFVPNEFLYTSFGSEWDKLKQWTKKFGYLSH